MILREIAKREWGQYRKRESANHTDEMYASNAHNSSLKVSQEETGDTTIFYHLSTHTLVKMIFFDLTYPKRYAF